MALLLYNVLMFVTQAASSSQGPPPPSQNRGPQFPIDDNIWVLIVVGFVFGIYMVYRRNRATSKAS